MRFVVSLGALACLAASIGASAPDSPEPGAGPVLQSQTLSAWLTLKNRVGWSIKYPPSWVTWSCRNCPDPTAPGVYVGFGQASSHEGFVMVQPLADKPPRQSAGLWLAELKRTANLNPIESERNVTVNGLVGLRVRYRSVELDIDADVIYFIAGSKTYSISFDRENLAKRLEDLPNYAVYERMIQTFQVQRR